MGVVFFLVVTPIGIVVRMLKGNPMVHTVEDGGYWHDRASPDDASSQSMERQF